MIEFLQSKTNIFYEHFVLLHCTCLLVFIVHLTSFLSLFSLLYGMVLSLLYQGLTQYGMIKQFFFFFCYSLQITHHFFSLSFQPLVWYGLQPALPRSHPVWHNRRQKWVQLDGRSPGSAGVLRGHHLHRVLHHDGHVVHQQARLQRDTSLRSLGPSMYKTEHVHIFFYFKCVEVSIFSFLFHGVLPLGFQLSCGKSAKCRFIEFFVFGSFLYLLSLFF